MVLWDCISLFDVEEERDLRYEDILETNIMMRSQGLIKENSLMLPKIKRLQKNVNKFQNNSSANKILAFTITSQNPRQINMPTKPKKKRQIMLNRISRNIRWIMKLWRISKR